MCIIKKVNYDCPKETCIFCALFCILLPALKFLTMNNLRVPMMVLSLLGSYFSVKVWWNFVGEDLTFFSPLLLSLIIYFSSFILQLIILPDDTPISAVEPRTHVQHAQVHSCRTHDIHDSPCISRVCARANHIIHSPHLPFTLKRPIGNYRTSHSSASLGRMFSKPYISLTEFSFP